jgi:hypothetical protein
LDESGALAPCDGITRFRFKGFSLAEVSASLRQRPCRRWQCYEWQKKVNERLGTKPTAKYDFYKKACILLRDG